MTLENLVPPLRLCKKIPMACFFSNSVLVWAIDYTQETPSWTVIPRVQLGSMDYAGWYNAPTLEEILAEMARLGFCPQVSAVSMADGRIGYTVQAIQETMLNPDSAATVALKLLLKMMKNRKNTKEAGK